MGAAVLGLIVTLANPMAASATSVRTGTISCGDKYAKISWNGLSTTVLEGKTGNASFKVVGTYSGGSHAWVPGDHVWTYRLTSNVVQNISKSCVTYH